MMLLSNLSALLPNEKQKKSSSAGGLVSIEQSQARAQGGGKLMPVKG